MTTTFIRFSGTLFCPEAILMAASEMTLFADIRLETHGANLVAQTTYDESKITAVELISRLNRSVSDCQLKITISEKTSFIRQMIIAQAFAPCDNLDEIVGAYERNDG